MFDRPDPTRRDTWRRLLGGITAPTVGVAPPMSAFGPEDPAVAAWRWCLDGSDAAAFRSLPGRRAAGAGPRPLLAAREDLAIEVWTECELAVLHAGFRRLVELGTAGAEVPGLESDLRDAVAWHLEHTQPDNATTHPWAIHALLELGEPVEDAIDDAGAMLHAMQAAAATSPEGRPDPLSLWIVADALATLERLPDGPLGSGLGAEDGDGSADRDR